MRNNQTDRWRFCTRWHRSPRPAITRQQGCYAPAPSLVGVTGRPPSSSIPPSAS